MSDNKPNTKKALEEAYAQIFPVASKALGFVAKIRI